MPSYQIYQVLTQAAWAFFVFAFGACVGSLTNVIVYRMPRGLNIVTPPSRCPKCDTRLTWRENIPIFGWIFLRGRCRFCKSKISPEYPLVEAFVACLFLLFFAVWYLLPQTWVVGGVNWGQFRPEWTAADAREIWPRHTWPTFLVVIGLVGSLVAMTLVDAKTFTIPLELPWFATIVAVVGHTAHAFFVERMGIRLPNPPMRSGQTWFLPTTDGWSGFLAVVGACVGLLVGILLIRFKLIRRSFADYDEWEKKALAAEQAAAGAGGTVAVESDGAMPGGGGGGPEMWIQYPHARREVLKELIFLTPCVVLGYVGWMAGTKVAGTPALWMDVLGGTLLGYLIGGGVVWAVRILGSLAFGKEAMGLGDVHLMAAVGAALGWVDSTIAFFGAAFVGLFWSVLAAVFSGKVSRTMPYGPYLAASTVLVMLLKPLICKGLVLLGIPAC